MLQDKYAIFHCCPDAQEIVLGKIEVPLTPPFHVGYGKGMDHNHSDLSLLNCVSVVVGADGINFMVSGNGNVNGLISDHNETIILCDISERVWASKAGSTVSGYYSSNINTSSLPSGSYILYVGAGEETRNQQIQIK